MQHHTNLIFFVFMLFCLCHANDQGCKATVTLAQRSSWDSNGETNQLWDMVATNIGSCPIETLFATIDVSEGSRIVHAWNYDNSTYELTGFLPSIRPGAIFKSAGFVHLGPGVPMISDVAPKCSLTCSLPSPISPQQHDIFDTRAWPIIIR
eukprot:Phypoly_transcript_22991.p1 GENE.Phypoly_transcript_22991~~Phypoly_transcript_22991.p1  ORF type:complete len:151 (+),score=1.18 Phypoly_transcript_22991:62-514(+)